ncbi:4'-phosphopantetheinyl transferase superfamily protein [Rhabdaerophilum sp. SD176]|uniref:4'-phosphopantetheinyl transferase family protein n=1 Tax=Rhabdaerophilum sp. SD176 TaxID=2983548 RepID=UPI0024DF9AA5|nr:4'-phosphopantetheinyl transferase superfamily protein [Rhabdaerophilum sp. SD176]
MTASESLLPATDEPVFAAGLLAWPDAPAIRERWRADGYVAAILDKQRPPELPPVLQEEAGSVLNHADPEGYLLRRRAIRALAGTVTGRAPSAFRIIPSAAGAPGLAGTGLWISFSGRPPYSAVLIARAPAGIDLEDLIPADDIPWNILCENERSHLQALPPPARGEAFTRLWSAKEAYAKALGQGFRLPPESLLVDRNGDARFVPAAGQSPLPDGRTRTAKGQTATGKALIIAMALLSS